MKKINKRYILYIILIVVYALIISRPSLFPGMSKQVNAARPFQLMPSAKGDAKIFVKMARNPEMLFEKGNVRQSRPLYIASAALLNSVVRISFDVFGIQSNWMKGWITEYISYISINFLLLWLAVMIFDKLIYCGKRSCIIIVIVSSYLVINDVTFVHLWSPHTQISNIFLPIFLVALSRKIITHPDWLPKHLISISIATGTLWIFYGSFCLTLPVIIISQYISQRISLSQKSTLTFGMLAIVILTILPTVLWIITLQIICGNYYNHEIEKYRQFIWVWDHIREGGMTGLIMPTFQKIVPKYIGVLSLTSFGYLLLLLFAIFLASASKISISYQNKSNIIAASICLPILILFFFFQKHYVNRLLWNVVPPLLVITGSLLTEVTHRCSPRKRNYVCIVYGVGAIAPMLLNKRLF